MGVTTAALCARRGSRIQTVGITLLALRTIGELLHGYVYGDEDWEEPDYGSTVSVDERAGERKAQMQEKWDGDGM
jgi:hypothetical protein